MIIYVDQVGDYQSFKFSQQSSSFINTFINPSYLNTISFLYIYHEDDFRFYFLIYTKYSNSTVITQIAWKQ